MANLLTLQLFFQAFEAADAENLVVAFDGGVEKWPKKFRRLKTPTSCFSM